jgi:hypothetical protein
MPSIAHKATMAVAVVVLAWPNCAISQARNNGPISGTYSLYSGELGDEVGLPNSKDAKVSIMISGPVAARMYQHMGGGARSNSCLESEETRARGNLMCTRKKDSGKAQCYFGFDLHSGKSAAGIVC